MDHDENTGEDDLLEELIANFLDAESHADPIDREAMLAQHPEHAESLRDFFATHDRMVAAADGNSSSPSQADADDDATLAATSTKSDQRTLPPRSPDPQENRESTVGDSVRYFGEYELLEEIARGGMGVVFKARQVNLNRVVALKMILAGQFAGEEDIQRFYTEAEAAAQLDHPGIVPIFEIGEHQGQHYFSMSYIEGENLAERVAEGPLSPREAAQLVADVCDAISYAHQCGVIHRDLKPANILIDHNGQPRVTDFGLAKKTESDSALTGTGQILGTPAYMPPEQAGGKEGEVGPLADVYSLGAVLYCLLTGRPPFQAASPMDTLLQVLGSDALPVRQLVPTTARDLETICDKCLNKDPSKRYGSAKDLSEDLRRFLENEPILARPAGWVERASKWATKQPVIAAILLSMPAWMLGEPKLGVGLISLVAGFFVPFRFRWLKLLAILLGTSFASVLITGAAMTEALADRSPGTEVLTGAIYNLGITSPLFVTLLVFLWDSTFALEESNRQRVRKWLIGSIVGTVIAVVVQLAYIGTQGENILSVSEQLVKEHYAATDDISFELFGDDSSSARTELARGRMFLWFPAVAGMAWIYLFFGAMAGRLTRRFVYVPAQNADKAYATTGATKTVDGDLTRWVAITAAVACAVLPFAAKKLLRLVDVDFASAIERGSILDGMLLFCFPAAWLAAYAVGSRKRLLIASLAGGLLCAFLALSTAGTIASRMFLYRDPPPRPDARQTAMRWDGQRRGLMSPLVSLAKDRGITIEGWMKPEGEHLSGGGSDLILVANTGFGNIKFGVNFSDSLNWKAAVRRVLDEPVRAVAPESFAFETPLDTAEWTHFAAVLHDDQLTLFVNGQRVDSCKIPEDWFFPRAWVVVMGGNPVHPNDSLVGLLDEVRISNTARYESDFQPQREWETDNQTVSLYHFDENNEGIIYDHSGNKHHIKDDAIEWVNLTETP